MYQDRNKELKVFAVFLRGYSRQFYLREISRLAGLPLKTAQDALARLEEAKVLKAAPSGKHKYFRLNLENAKTKLLILQAEVRKTIELAEDYPLFNAFLKALRTDALIILFGSFVRLEAGKESDVDLLVVSREEEKLPAHLLPYMIHKIWMSGQSFVNALEKRETLLSEVEENHVVLNNHSAYVNAMWNYYGK